MIHLIREQVRNSETFEQIQVDELCKKIEKKKINYFIREIKSLPIFIQGEAYSRTLKKVNKGLKLVTDTRQTYETYMKKNPNSIYANPDNILDMIEFAKNLQAKPITKSFNHKKLWTNIKNIDVVNYLRNEFVSYLIEYEENNRKVIYNELLDIIKNYVPETQNILDTEFIAMFKEIENKGLDWFISQIESFDYEVQKWLYESSVAPYLGALEYARQSFENFEKLHELMPNSILADSDNFPDLAKCISSMPRNCIFTKEFKHKTFWKATKNKAVINELREAFVMVLVDTQIKES